MVCTYSLVEEKIGERMTYGISASNSDGEVLSYKDVLLDRERMVDLIRRCNEGKLRLCHLLDVIYDAIE